MRVINMKNKKLFSTFDIILSGLFIALFTIGAYVRIPVFGVPFTLQLFFVLLAGQILKWYMAAFSVISYIVLGLLGLPVFAGGGGVGYALTPSFGYLLGFVLCAAIISLFPKNISLTKLIFKNILGVILVYAFAIIYTCLLTLFYFNKPLDFWYILLSGCLVFLPTDIIFCVISAVFSKRINSALIKIKP